MWRLRDRVHAALTDEGGAILDERSGRWSHLTTTAAVMLLRSCPSEEQAAARFAQRYGIPSAQAATDVRAVAEALVANGLTTYGAAPSRRRWQMWRWWR
ncbi:PqqD family peptide modification chaperone [Streptomyces sp. NPDC044780]|uniref:PqqD family peptide modification chaperone n=1 Tax=unclassified Streptomyces TaxID=2593676 RepID=UPI0034030F70